jgi:ABC-type multidrug transport system ATPase subunit/pSer/pThr/pTyr-binding forkhead associated (FHA) protein
MAFLSDDRCLVGKRLAIMLTDQIFLNIHRADAPPIPCRLEPGYVLVGRAHQASLRLEDHQVSGRHCLLRIGQGRATVEDLGSTNGTYLNGHPLPPYQAVPLNPGDQIRVGPFHLVLATRPPSSPRPLPLSVGREKREGTISFRPEREKQASTKRLNLAVLGKSELLIGRAPDCDIRLSHPAVSRYHARLRRRRAGWLAEDLGSIDGTFVDGLRLVRPTLLHEGQKLEVVGHRFAISGRSLVQFEPSGVQHIDAVGLGVRVRSGKVILRSIYLHAEAGEFIALVGSSGAGKTTLLNALSGYAPASRGQVLFDGRDLYQHYDLLRSQIGYVPQQDILHETLPLERALLYSARLRLPDRSAAQSHPQRVEAVIAQLGLSRARQQTINTLSGGERKRTNLAAEMIVAPSVLFLDEPAAGLDSEVENVLMAQLRDLADSGKIVMVCTHATQNVMLCDMVAVIGTGGYLAYYGPPEEALDYFEVKTFPEIYRRLAPEDAPVAWAKTYRASAAADKYVRRPQANQPQYETPARLKSSPQVKRPPRLRQLAVLTTRYLDLLARDRRNLLMLLLQAPAIALLMKMGFSPTAFEIEPPGNGQSAIMILFFLALVPIWLGIFSATREIVKELPIYRRERMATIDVWPYLSSKVIVLSGIGAIQIGSLLLVASLVIELPLDDLAGYLQWAGTLMLANLLGMGMGLLVSATVSKTDKVNTIMLFLIIPQMLLAGAFITLREMGAVTEFFSLFAGARWTFETLGAQIDILEILEQQGGRSLAIAQGFAPTFGIDVTGHVAIMAAGFILLLAGCYVALRLKDPL